MIKLVLVDLDGTLFNSKKEVPDDFYEIYNGLKTKGIMLGIASGRSYSSIQRDFPIIAKESALIVEGGGCTFYEGKMIDQQVIPKEEVIKIIKKAKTMSDAFPIVCAKDVAYIEKKDNTEVKLKEVKMYYPSYKVVDCLEEVEDDISKITLYDFKVSQIHSYPIMKEFEDRCNVIPSALNWMDVCVKDVSKATGIKAFMNVLKLKETEIMAFGDYLNDYEMLEMLNNSYAMSNAHPKIKEVCSYICESNEECGVTKTLRKLFL